MSWIKFRAELYSHPKFLSLYSDLLQDEAHTGLLAYTFGSNEIVTKPNATVTDAATRDIVMCALLRVWSAVNGHCKVRGQDGIMAPMTLDQLDGLAGFSNFGRAMMRAGWETAACGERSEETAC